MSELSKCSISTQTRNAFTSYLNSLIAYGFVGLYFFSTLCIYCGIETVDSYCLYTY